MGPSVILIGCVKQKQDRPAHADQMYTSELFKRRRAYAEASGRPWYIISAKHGLLRPLKIIGPYDVTLADLSKKDLHGWALKIALELFEQHAIAHQNLDVEIHAGQDYVTALRDPLTSAWFHVTAPLRGLQIGEQLKWYAENPPPAPHCTLGCTGPHHRPGCALAGQVRYTR